MDGDLHIHDMDMLAPYAISINTGNILNNSACDNINALFDHLFYFFIGMQREWAGAIHLEFFNTTIAKYAYLWNTSKIVKAFISLGHEVIMINERALLMPLAMEIDAIYSGGNNVSYRKLAIVSQITKKPIADFRWCCQQLAALLNAKQGGSHDLTH